MSNKENETKGSQAQEETREPQKVVTRYDRKMQRRREEEAKAKRDQKIAAAVGIAFLAVVLILILSFPIRNLLAVSSDYIKVGDEGITRVEFDYNYAVARNSYLNEYGSYLSMFGMTDLASLENQMYSGTLTFRDYFEELAVENIRNTKALSAEAKVEGFTYDTTAEYEEMRAQLQSYADEAGVSLKEYIRKNYGTYATEGRLEDIIRETIFTTAFYAQKAEELAATDDEVQSYYEENRDTYDSVDYHMSIVTAELPATAPDGSVVYDENGNEAAYTPTEEEIAAAMEEAKSAAEALQAQVTESGDEYINASNSSVTNSMVREFLYDESRKAGDTTVIEDAYLNRYLVVSFDDRYLDEAPTVDMRAIVTSTYDPQMILDEWSGGEATEESFIGLAGLYDENNMGGYDFLYEGLDPAVMSEQEAEWLGSADRAAGDTAAFTDESGTGYVFYYVGQNEAAWKLSIRSTLLEQNMNNYLDTISENYPVDGKGNLNYLKVQEAEAAVG